MSPSDLQTFAREALCDNRLAAMAVEASERLSLQTVVELAGQADAVWILTSLQTRNCDLIEDHRLLWQQTADFFQDAAAIWKAVPAKTNSELLDAHRQLLARLLELSRDRVEFYTVSDSERRAHHAWKMEQSLVESGVENLNKNGEGAE